MEFTSREYAEMHFVYGFCDGNARAAQREYRARYPNRRVPSPEVFSRLHLRLLERGTVFKQRNEVGPVRHNVNTEELVLNMVEENPQISSRQVANDVGVSQWKVLSILHKNQFHPYHFIEVQGLEPQDYVPRVQFCRWLLNADIEQAQFLKNILYTDESKFTRDGVFNIHNMHHWAQENPKVMREGSHQTRFHLNVWIGVIGDQLVGPHIFQENLSGEAYLDFLQHSLPNLLDGLDLTQRQRDNIIFQQDGAPPHFSNDVRNWLTLNYPTWIGRGGPVPWPARSPDLTPLDFFVWGTMKDIVYSAPVNSVEELTNRVEAAAQVVREKLTFNVTVRAMRKRARACIRKGGRQFENDIK